MWPIRSNTTLFMGAAAMATLATAGVHLWVVRPRANWKLESGLFTIYLNTLVGQVSPAGDGFDPPKESDSEHNISRLCLSIVKTMMP